MPQLRDLLAELDNITALNYVNAASNFLEKIFWSVISICGSIWICSVVANQISFWNQNPVMITKGTKLLSDLDLPAITLCPKVIQYSGFPERMINHIDENGDIPKEIFEIRNQALHVQFLKFKETFDEKVDLLQFMETDKRYHRKIEKLFGKSEVC